MENRSRQLKFFRMLVFASLLLTLVVVVLSAYIRLDGIGLGCGDWPRCFGQIPMTSDAGTLPTTLAGVMHRITASLLGLLVMTITVLAIRHRGRTGTGLTVPLLAFVLILFLSVLGFNTPAWQFPAVTLGNLVGGMMLLSLLWWMGQRSLADETVTDSTGSKFRPWVLAGIGTIMLQIALGAWASANFAGPACPALPVCARDWVSLSQLFQGFDLSRQLAMDNQGKIIVDNTQATLHMVHRIGALLTLLYIGGLAALALRRHEHLRFACSAILFLLLVQASLGVIQLLTELPLLLVTAHNAVAAVLLLAVVNLFHRLTPKQVR